MTRVFRNIISAEATAYYADRLLFSIHIYDILYTDILIYRKKGDGKMKVKYTYQTDAERLQILKIIAVHNNRPLNKLLDDIIDEYIKKDKKA